MAFPISHALMKTLRFVCLVQLILLTAEMLFGATLVSLVDARRSGGTATGTFVANELPSFLLAPVSGTFGIRNTGAHPAGQWEFAVGAGGLAVVKDTTTINLSEITSFSSAAVAIDAEGIGFSADRFNPTETGYLFARLGEGYHAFRVAKWSTNNNANANGDRVRFYEAMPATLAAASSSISVVPEPSTVLAAFLGAMTLVFRRKRQP
jgi:hypothetical protein